MNADNEQRFMTVVDSFEFGVHDVSGIVRKFDDWLREVERTLSDGLLVVEGVNGNATLAREAEAINTVLSTRASIWRDQWHSLESAQALSSHLADKAIFLVFGKFNAGKSSLCNLLAERFGCCGRNGEYFYIDEGRIVTTDGKLSEGATESTARLQGVTLGGQFVLLDTPGLHSMTEENAALTQRFTDSADAILWLTSSAAPGQVQELDDLSRELRRNKPLLPIITRSDFYEEDEVDGELRRVLRNKSQENRALQEADVKARALEKLDSMGVNGAVLLMPVSLSAMMMRNQQNAGTALTESGFDRLYGSLLAMGESALAYKRRKAAEVWLHHLEENVLGSFHRDVLPLLAAFDASLQTALDGLDAKVDQTGNAVWRSVIPALPELIDSHADVARYTLETFCTLAREALSDYRIELTEPSHEDNPNGERSDYAERHAMLREQVRYDISALSRELIGQCRHSINHARSAVHSLRNTFETHETALSDLKRTLRNEFK